jgi:DNA-directed RNA polymerase specialized sigma24 family protein
MGQLLERRRAVHRFVRHFGKLDQYIQRNVRRYNRGSLLYAVDDLVQDAAMVLWKLIETYPKLKGVELVKMFKTCFTRYLINVHRHKRVKAERKAVPYDPLAAEADQIRQGISGRILPWDFFRVRLSGLSARLDRDKYKRLVEVPSRINDEYLRRKEVELRNFL